MTKTSLIFFPQTRKDKQSNEKDRDTCKDKYNISQLNPEADGKQKNTFRKKQLYLRFGVFFGFQ